LLQPANTLEDAPMMEVQSSNGNANRPLAERLRKTLAAARGDLQIRQRLRGLISDPERWDPIVRELGPSHAVLRDLLEVGGHGEHEPVRG
jgi:hypothetical protein